jgi:hypothetical protein
MGQNSTGQVLSEIAFDKPGHPLLPRIVFTLQSEPRLEVMLNHLIEDRVLRPSRAVDPGAVWLFRVGGRWHTSWPPSVLLWFSL